MTQCQTESSQPAKTRAGRREAVRALCLLCCIALVACSTPPPAPATVTPAPAATALAAAPATSHLALVPAQPGAATPVPATPTTLSAPFVYRVQAGDTLLEIAARFDVSVAAIMAANGLDDPDTLAIDQELVIPAGSPPASDAPVAENPAAEAQPPVNPAPIVRPTEPFVYRVQAGDTLLSLSARYGAAVADIMAANNLASADTIVIDQELLIPIGGLSVPATGSFIHRVEPGDTLFGLAMHYGVTVADIMALNRLASADALAIGQDLRIPTTGAPSPAAEAPAPPPPAETPTPEVSAAAIPTLPPASIGGLEQYRAWMEEAHGMYPYAESIDVMWAVMMCESGGYPNLVGAGTYYGLFQYRLGTWAGAWNPYRDSPIFDPRAQIFATAKAWLEGHQGWWRGCWPH